MYELEKKLTEARKREEVMKENIEKYRHPFKKESDAVPTGEIASIYIDETKRKRMGLQGMEERVNLLNGKLRIQSRMGEGTRIFVEVPYKEKRVGSETEYSNH